MIEIPEDVITGPEFKKSTQKTYINEKTISGLTPIKCEHYWLVSYWQFGKDQYDKCIIPRYVFKVYFDGNSESYNYLSLEVAQSWYDFIKGCLSNN
jgi:hypothetical protein